MAFCIFIALISGVIQQPTRGEGAMGNVDMILFDDATAPAVGETARAQ